MQKLWGYGSIILKIILWAPFTITHAVLKRSTDFWRKKIILGHNNGHLASVTNEKVHQYIQGRLQGSIAWIGGIDLHKNSKWLWADCQDWDFTRWMRHEPNNPNENCVEYSTHSASGKWNDKKCTAQSNFICSKMVCSGIV